MKKWLGKPPKICDVCKRPIGAVFYDTPLLHGQWCLACHRCFTLYKPTMGQKYDTDTLAKIGIITPAFTKEF